VLLVAEKYQTGFDQPLLHTMYVDKRLAGIQAVQTLSRLNRTHPLKEDAFVLDFVNDPEEIQEAFRQYYEGSVMGEQVDPHRLYEVKAELDAAGIYLQTEVDAFARVFFAPKRRQSPGDHQAMNALLDQAVARFTQWRHAEEDEAELWRGKLQAFRNLYGFLSQVIPYQDSDLEKLYTYLRYLALKLPKRKTGPGYRFDEEVSLDYYRLQKINSLDKFQLVFRQVLESLFIERMELNEGLFADYMGKPEMQEIISKWLGSQVYERLSATMSVQPPVTDPVVLRQLALGLGP
jgi:type I restriction enzyme, R subunit